MHTYNMNHTRVLGIWCCCACLCQNVYGTCHTQNVPYLLGCYVMYVRASNVHGKCLTYMANVAHGKIPMASVVAQISKMWSADMTCVNTK